MVAHGQHGVAHRMALGGFWHRGSAGGSPNLGFYLIQKPGFLLMDGGGPLWGTPRNAPLLLQPGEHTAQILSSDTARVEDEERDVSC